MNYERLARYYDAIHDPLTEDIGLVLTLAERAPSPVVELGCGTGRLLVPLARARHTVIGLDNSPAMLARATQRIAAEPEPVQERIALRQGDMVDYALDRRAGLIVVGYNTLLHLETQRALPAALRAIARNLLPEGRLFLDLANPFALAATPDEPQVTLENSFVDGESGEIVLQLAAGRLDPERQILTVTWLFDRNPVGGGALQRDVAQMRYHYLFPHQLQMQLSGAGLVVEAQYGAYNQAPFAEDSDRLLVVARKE